MKYDRNAERMVRKLVFLTTDRALLEELAQPTEPTHPPLPEYRSLPQLPRLAAPPLIRLPRSPRRVHQLLKQEQHP